MQNNIKLKNILRKMLIFMKRIVILLSLVLGSLSFSFGLGYPQITVEKGYCEGGKVIRRYTMGEEVHGGGGTRTVMNFKLCRINGLRYRNIGVTILGYYKNSTLSMNEGINIAIDYDKRIIFYDPAGL